MLRVSGRPAEALRAPLTSPDARVLEGAVEIVVLSLSDGNKLEPVPLQILMGREWILTRHDAPLPYLARRRERLRDERQIGLLKPVEFLVSVLDWHVDSFFATADELER